jgi:DNA-binding MarR family transcriptional regulator
MKDETASRALGKKAIKAEKECVCFNVRRAARALTKLYDTRLKPSGLRVTQFTLLMATKLLEPVTVNRLARLAVMDRTTLTRNLRPLEKQGLIRVEYGEDRRERRVTLTVRGQQTLAKAVPLWEQEQARVAHGFGYERLAHLFADLTELVKVGRAA